MRRWRSAVECVSQIEDTPVRAVSRGSVGRTMFNRSQILVSLLAALLAGCRKIEMVSMEGMP